MKLLLRFCFCLLLALPGQGAPLKTNVLLVLAEDQGWGDVRCTAMTASTKLGGTGSNASEFTKRFGHR